MVKEAVAIEKDFVSECLPVSLIGMNKDLMCQYIEYVADHLLLNLIGKVFFNSENPFEWMVYLSMENKTNFFEHRPTEYSKSESSAKVEFDEEF